MEQNLLTRDGTARLLSEAALAHEGPPKAEGEQASLRADLERMASLDGLQLLVDDIDVQPQGATADYRVVGRARPGGPPPPFGGRLALRRTRGGWRLEANRFLEEAPQDDSPVKRRVHQPTHAGLAGRLGMIALLALLSAAAVGMRSFLTRGSRGRGVRQGRRRGGHGA